MRTCRLLLLVVGLVCLAAASGACGTAVTPTPNQSKPAEAAGPTAPTPPSKPIEIKIGFVTAPKSSYDELASKFAELADKKSNGRIKVSVFPSGQLGQEPEALQGLTLGTIDAYVIATGVLASVVPEIGDSDLPYLYKSKAHADKVLEGEPGQYWAKLFEPKGVKILGWGAGGFRNSLNARKPIKTVDDFKGMKFRIYGGPVFLAMYRALGANAIVVNWNEVYTALQQKVVDGVEAPINVLYSDKMYEVAKYLTLDEHVYQALSLSMSMKTFNSLPPDLQQVVLEAGKEAGAYERDFAQKMDVEALPAMQSAGVQVSEVEKEPFIKAMAPVYDELGKNKDLIRKIQSMQ